MSRIIYNDTYSYEILPDGYDIYENDVKIITQHDPYGKVFKKDGTYEENAILQLDQITAPQPEPGPVVPSEEEKLRADVDYIAIMEDLVLPSQEEN